MNEVPLERDCCLLPCVVSPAPCGLQVSIDQVETEFESLPWGWGCNEDVVVTADHRPSMTQPDGALVKESQGWGGR